MPSKSKCIDTSSVIWSWISLAQRQHSLFYHHCSSRALEQESQLHPYTCITLVCCEALTSSYCYLCLPCSDATFFFSPTRKKSWNWEACLEAVCILWKSSQEKKKYIDRNCRPNPFTMLKRSVGAKHSNSCQTERNCETTVGSDHAQVQTPTALNKGELEKN